MHATSGSRRGAERRVARGLRRSHPGRVEQRPNADPCRYHHHAEQHHNADPVATTITPSGTPTRAQRLHRPTKLKPKPTDTDPAKHPFVAYVQENFAGTRGPSSSGGTR